MNQDSTFRIPLIILMVVTLGIALYHRLKAHTNEPLDRRQEGLLILGTLRPAAGLYYVGFFAYLIRPSSMAWSSLPLPNALRWAGLAIGVAGGVLLFWTMHNLAGNITDTVVTRREAYLVTSGPYRWMRHPFYGAVAMFMLAMALMTANWFLLVTGSVVYLLLVLRTTKEEANLVARFGDDYRGYMARTGRFFPRIG